MKTLVFVFALIYQVTAQAQALPLSQSDLNFLTASQPPASTQPPATQSECARSTLNNQSFGWCLTPTDRDKNPNVIYFFHGLTLNEHRWDTAQFTQDMVSIWKAQGLTPPTVVTISFGPVWLLTEVPGSAKLYDLFVQQIMPFFENMIGPVTRDQRIALGESMGGFNASQLLVKNPELFSKFALQCPAITPVGPFDSDAETLQFLEQSGAEPFHVLLTKIIGMWTFKNEANWLNHAPLVLAAARPNVPAQIYLSCGTADEFGFEVGTGQLYNELLNKTQGIQYELIQGGTHSTVDAQKMANFLSSGWSSVGLTTF
jgi:pimeloyl-ACP methyl ester carboxylesterase